MTSLSLTSRLLLGTALCAAVLGGCNKHAADQAPPSVSAPEPASPATPPANTTPPANPPAQSSAPPPATSQ